MKFNEEKGRRRRRTRSAEKNEMRTKMSGKSEKETWINWLDGMPKEKCTLIMIASESWCALCHSNCKNFYLFYEQIFLCQRRPFARIDAYIKLWVKRQKRRKMTSEKWKKEKRTNERMNERRNTLKKTNAFASFHVIPLSNSKINTNSKAWRKLFSIVFDFRAK